MPNITFENCARCPVLRHCSAHITGGEWRHDKGVDPCVVVMGDGDQDTVVL